MNNVCLICKATIDEQWSSLQNEIKKTKKTRWSGKDLLAIGLVERCIYCYKNLVMLTEKREHEWYREVVKAIEKRFAWLF